MVPPMRPRAGTTLTLSTVAKTAFSSATDREATVRISARAEAIPNVKAATRLNAINSPHRFICILMGNCLAALRRLLNYLIDIYCEDLDLPQGTAAPRAHSLSPCLRGFRRRAIHLIESFQNFARGIACDRVVDRLGIPPRRHQAILAKEGKMLGHRGVPKAQEFGKVADRALAIDQLTDNEQPVAVGERLSTGRSPGPPPLPSSLYSFSYLRIYDIYEYIVNRKPERRALRLVLTTFNPSKGNTP